ncbi:MAG TPA: ABC transporter substrate binding protein, partial [Alphaproteobacteria bacterium]
MRPFAADAQQSGRPVVGFLRSTPAQPFESLVTAFVGGLKDGGFVAGQTVEVEYRYADNQLKRLPDLAADLIGRKAAVIVTNGVAALAIKATVTAVPIVFTDGGDPVQQGLVSNIARPGGNITGVTFFSGALGPKRLELLRALVPDTALYAMLVGPHSIETEIDRTAVQEAVQAIGRRLVVADAANDTDIDAAFAMFAQLGAG